MRNVLPSVVAESARLVSVLPLRCHDDGDDGHRVVAGMKRTKTWSGKSRNPGARSEGAAEEEEEATEDVDPAFPLADPAPELPCPPVAPGAPPYQPAGALVSEGGGYCVCGPGGQL